jgi:hypothetical protein
MTQTQPSTIKPLLKPRASKSRFAGGIALSAGAAALGAVLGAVFMSLFL